MGEGSPSGIAASLSRIRERIACAAERVGRRPQEVRLVAVSKLVETGRVQEAVAAGVTDLGENYVQEAAAKRGTVAGPVRWHLIGHLQSNKVGAAASLFDLVQTIDDVRTAAALGRHGVAAGRTLDVLLQVTTSGEEQKSGVAPTEAGRLLEAVLGVPGVRVQGLMTIGRLDPEAEAARPSFRLLAELAHDLSSEFEIALPWLSMGMTHDFEVAVEEGSTLVRVGTGIFGERRGHRG